MPELPPQNASSSVGQSPSSGVRFSLRWLLGVVTICAITAAAVKYASHLWLGIISLVTLALLAGAVLLVVYGRAKQRAFAVGFLIGCVPYIVLATWFMPETDQTQCRFVTSQLLHKLLPYVTRQTGTQQLYIGGGGFPGGGYWPGMPAGGTNAAGSGGTLSGSTTAAAPAMTLTTVPLIEPTLEDFIYLGEMLWGWLFGACGGLAAMFLWRRRNCN